MVQPTSRFDTSGYVTDFFTQIQYLRPSTVMELSRIYEQLHPRQLCQKKDHQESNPCKLTLAALSVMEAFEELCKKQKLSMSASNSVKPLFLYCRNSADLMQEAAKQVQRAVSKADVINIAAKKKSFLKKDEPSDSIEVQKKQAQVALLTGNALADADEEDVSLERINPHNMIEVQEEEDRLKNELSDLIYDDLIFELMNELRAIEATKKQSTSALCVNDESHRAVVD